MNVMITGCAGFIGSHAVDHFLNLGYNVTGVDCFTYAANSNNIKEQYNNPDFKLFRLNICSASSIKELVELRKIQWIINFAAETHVDNSIKSASEFIRSNVEGVRSLLEVCRETGANLFQISTDEVYGSIMEGSYSEGDKLDPQNPYSATKAAAEHMIKAYSNTYKTKYLMVRPANNFGPRQHGEKFLPTIVRNLLADRKIPVYGDGLNVREWLFVKDSVKAIEFILRNSDLNETYNISSNTEMTNIEVVNKVCRVLEKNTQENIEFVADRPGHDFRYSVSNYKLSKLGFDDYSFFDESLKEVVGAL